MTPIELNAALAYADFLDQHLPEIAGCPAGNTVRALVEEIGRLGNEIKQLRAIPADRVLGEGERRICSEELMYLRSLERYARKHGPESIQDVIGCLDHLRANQGEN